MKKRRVAVVGATGLAGQQFLASLAGHPWFEVAVLAASARSAGKPYGEAIRDANGARRWWVAGTEPAAEFLGIQVEDATRIDPGSVDLVFAAVESDVAKELEPVYARAVPVVSTAAFRRARHADRPRASTSPPTCHCSRSNAAAAAGRDSSSAAELHHGRSRDLLEALALIASPCDRSSRHRSRHLRRGAVLGVVALDIVDNVIPYIPKEEEKVAAETRKILGRLGEGGREPHPAAVGATCTRVGVLEGHTLAITVETERPCDPGSCRRGDARLPRVHAGLDHRARPPIRSSSTTTRSVLSRASTARRGRQRRASDGSSRCPRCRAGSSTSPCPTTRAWVRPRSRAGGRTLLRAGLL
jgi:aspartate-semialdehyde dehydrogenase